MSALHARIESAIRTAKQWENDAALLSEIRASLPLHDLVPEQLVPLESRWKAFLSNDASVVDATEHQQQQQHHHDNINAQAKRSPYHRDDDAHYESDDLLLQRLTLYFKRDVMTWVNQPPCANPHCTGNGDDGKQRMMAQGTRGPVSDEEKIGQASRVEVYTCQQCNTETTFPRYNSPRALFSSRRGRCGEYANLFGAYCRAVGFDTRYCLDLTDHVWTEVWSVRQGRWLHVDSCEGLIDRPNMYEQGWGKKLSYVIGATHDSVADVTKRYTRQFFSDEFQTRRREFSPDENASDRAFLQANVTVKQIMSNIIPRGRMEELEKRGKAEEMYFGLVQASGVWDSEYKEGRISGSWAWKAARSELGHPEKKANHDKNNTSQEKDSKKNDQEASFLVESFYPAPHRQNNLTIRVQHPSSSSTYERSRHDCIIVNGIPCAATLSPGISVVVVDEQSGCILQSRAFSKWSSLGIFIDTVPAGRIVAICSNVLGDTIDDTTSTHLLRVGGLSVESKASQEALLLVGQIGFHPKWATSIHSSDESKVVEVTIQLNISPSLPLKLRTENSTAPAMISTRLPETIMPLKTQMVATEYQKRVAFEAFTKQSSNTSSSVEVVGYVTRPEAPIYLIGNDSFPFRRADGPSHDSGKSWVTYHYLPDALVPDDDIITEETGKETAKKIGSGVAKFDIPVVDDYFMGLLGTELLTKSGASPPSLMNTTTALANNRLIALYFSAHWCGPCRGFTPMLIEFYNYLKEEVAPTHGLEIIFVSSDRSEAEFQQYYQGMPFKAIPFQNRTVAQQIKSVFGVRGIPSLVVMDAMSGRIVVSQEDSRREVHQACNRGEQAIETLFNSWLDKVPAESKAMLDILALSCEEAEKTAGAESDKVEGATRLNSKASDYLIRKKTANNSDDSAAVVKSLFTELVADGMSPNEAAAEAIKRTTQKPLGLFEGSLKGFGSVVDSPQTHSISIVKAAEVLLHLNGGDKSKVANVVTTAKKYVTNALKEPTNSRFRTFRLGNKVFDQITSVAGSIQLLTCVGFSVFPSDADFVAAIPLSLNLNEMNNVLDKLLEVYKN
eukprot:CCRYP_005259-RA/>CCRYP_005259-RA protein AED:0.02 eAED:0.02 QI:1661/1/1/1/0.75/0.6/5/3045/1066